LRTIDPFVIVGGGLAGGNAAATLRTEGFDGPIIILGNEPGVPFGRPPLSKEYLRDEAGIDDWLVRPAAWYEKAEVDLRPASPVAELDIPGKKVRLVSGESISYAKLLLATGGRPRTVDLPGRDLNGIHHLRTQGDCDAIKAEVKPGARVVIVGMGFIGAEIAASLRQLGLEVTVLFPGEVPFARQFGPEVGAALRDLHQESGVQLRANEHARAFAGEARVRRVVTDHGKIECDLAVVAVGIDPNVELARTAGVPVTDGIVVDGSLRSPAPEVFAAGDVANVQHRLFGPLRVEHFNVAERQGRAAGRSMLGLSAAYDEIPSFWSDQYDEKLEYVGYVRTWDQLVVRGSLEQRRFLAFYLNGSRLRAALGLNRGGDPELDEQDEMAMARRMIAGRKSLDPRLLADQSIPLKELC
jgi:3-phenylpropionate/trans-cinnamate dioxygenase ferredoxin reductase subunit